MKQNNWKVKSKQEEKPKFSHIRRGWNEKNQFKKKSFKKKKVK